MPRLVFDMILIYNIFFFFSSHVLILKYRMQELFKLKHISLDNRYVGPL